MNKRDILFLATGFIGLFALYGAQDTFYHKKISSVANEQGMLIITLANFNENKDAYEGLAYMFGNSSKLGGHINNIYERKKEVQKQFYLLLAVGLFLIGISAWLFYSTYKHPSEDRLVHKPTLLLITLLLGGLGFHKFYTGNYKLGFIYGIVYLLFLAFNFFPITGIIAYVELIRYAIMRKDTLQTKYEQKANQPFGFIW